ncbi:MAG: outer membrane lipoprotein-sorting protein [Bacteroidales bacterium]|jgi:outer membrane lipoprotein-sorting protein|nr:outer membrane lipoprotein-sorting protein [Bacteroidales bacterium]
MKRIILLLLAIIPLTSFGQPGADEIIDRVDRNMSADNQVVESQMIIHGRRASRTITSVSYTVGDKKSFTEYLSPPREQGTKMLKLEDQLWIYSPSTDRTIQISGHMLRQSVMGSDLSYEDLMNDRKLTDVYSARVTGSEEIDGRDTWVLHLEATVSDIAYASRRVWIDKEKYVPLKEELYAKSGQLLKRSSMSDIRKVDGRWYPMTIIYKDVLKQGDGTEFKVIDIKFNQDIPEYMFSKAALKQ